MSTSIAANVPPYTAPPETHVTPSSSPSTHEGACASSAPPPADGIPFGSPVVRVDADTGLALLVVRDSSSGEELYQYPSKQAVEEYQRVQSSGGAASDKAAASDKGQSLTTDAKTPPAPVTVPPVGVAAESGTSTSSGRPGVKPVTL